MLRHLLCLCLLTTFVWAESHELLWPDLQGNVDEFDDPFNALDSDQLFHLGMVARLRAKQDSSEDPLPAEDLEELADRTAKLEAQDIDIDYLLEMRTKVTELRRQRAMSTREDYDGKTIRMPGYLLPLDVTEGEVMEYLLVPWVGACIHTPPPPPNQIVYVQLSQPWKVRSQWEPVYVEGTMQSGDITKDLYLVDGTADIHIGYTLSDAVTTPFEDEE
ncbi:MAG: hypothetical protein SynsKO_24640 [Synoicihabitans sp.]